jgi:hypothetical protein
MNAGGGSHWLWRGFKWLLALELGYLLVVNALLNLPLTQDVVNWIRPEKFHVRWESAWSLYPFRVHARGIAANGQTRSQQWQVAADAAAANVALLPLVLKRVHLRQVSAINVDYRQRPRLKPDKDYSGMIARFPPIEGREVLPVDISPRKRKRPWKVRLRDGHVSGDLSAWIYALQTQGRGSAFVDLDAESRGGPFSLSVTDLDLTMGPGSAGDDTDVYQGGTIRGSLGFVPFVPRENRGLAMLPFLQLDATLDMDVGQLLFINLFTGGLGDFYIDGAGTVKGRLNYDQGYLRAGTNLRAVAADLGLHMHGLNTLGQGVFSISAPVDSDTPVTLSVRYDALTVTRDGDSRPFLQGDGMLVEYAGGNYVAPEPGLSLDTVLNDERYLKRRENSTFRLDVRDATVTDLPVLNRYLPAGTGLRFTGGTAQLDADLFAAVKDVQGEIQLRSEDVAMRLDGQDLQGDLNVDLVVVGGVPRERRVQLDGSRVELGQVSVVGQEGEFSGKDAWSATVTLPRAEAVLVEPPMVSADATLAVSDTRPLIAVFENQSGSPGWIARLLTLEDITGEARLELADQRLTVPKGHILSDRAEVGAKVTFDREGREGMIYARYRKLEALLKMQGEKRNVDVFRARETYDNYELGTQAPAL